MHITQAQKDLYKFCSPSDIRPILQCVRTDGRTAVATDSFRLVEVTNTDAEPVLDQERAMITAKSLKAAKIKIKDGTSAAMDRQPGHRLVIASEGTTAEVIESVERAEEFPNYAQIIPADKEEPLVSINFTAEYLKDMAAFFEKHAMGGAVNIKFYGAQRVAVFSAEGTGKINQKIRGLLMPRNR